MQLVQDIPNVHVVCPTQITNWVPLDEAEDADYITIWEKLIRNLKKKTIWDKN